MEPKKDDSQPQWFVMRAYKSERQAEDLLMEDGGLRFFIPKHYVVRIFHGVKSKRLVPVIPSLIFVLATHDRILAFKQRHNFLQFVMRKTSDGTDYLIVPDDQMDNFIKVASQYEESTVYFKPEEIDIRKGTRIRIHGGRFDGVDGVFMQVKGRRNRRLVVMLDGIMAVVAEVCPELVEVL